MASKDHPRRIIPNLFPVHVCKELEFIHKSNCTVGYRPNVFSTTLSHLIATNSSYLIMPFIPLREKLKEIVEETFDCQYELFIEFTGLISWNKGASIGWHSDDNRPYLKQRDFTIKEGNPFLIPICLSMAVCYLNSYGEDFSGGMFHFQDGEPENYVPMAGDLVLYSADSRNVHCVDEITDGERLTLTLWFSRDNSFDEDAKLLSLLAQSIIDNEPVSCIPLPAPSNMYWFSLNQACDNQQGYDIHFARLFVLGFDIYPAQEKSCFSEKHSQHSSNVFTEPLQLVRECKLYSRKFTNLLHALQAVQFYYWKQQALQQREIFMDNTNDVSLLSDEQKEVVHELRSAFSSAIQLDTRVLCYSSTANSSKLPFDWACFSAAITCWEEYTFELLKQLRMHIPFWKDHQSLFSVSSSLDK